MSKFLKFWPFVVIILFGLTPLLWFYRKGNILINGVDTNFPLDPLIWFQRRFFVWNAVSNAGQDFSSSTAGLFFHLVQVIPYKLGLNLPQVQLVSLIFWFSLIIFGSFIFARTLFPKRFFIQLVFVSLYCFNIYLFNSWENIKVSNLALVAALPLVLALLTLLRQSLITKTQAALLSVFVGVILSGAGINPAYFASFFLIASIFIISDIITNFRKQFIFLRITHLLLVSIPILLVNLFWILPTTSFIVSNISSAGSIDKIGFTNWIDSLSENTSILNIMRLQGAWDWYPVDPKTDLPFYIPYATNYFYKLPFILFSFLLPTLVLISLFISNRKDSHLYIGFSLMFILGVFLGVGTYLPTGNVFRWLSVHLPFFTLFRSPWYIFTPLVTLSTAGLISLLLCRLEDRVHFRRKELAHLGEFIVPMLSIILIAGNLLYNYPLISGKIFRPGRSDGFYVEFPGYIFEAKKWLSEKTTGRVIGYPDSEVENFSWGYRGIESILELLADRETLFVSLNNPDSPVSYLIKELYLTLKKRDIESAQSIAGKLNVGLVFEKNDQQAIAEKLSLSTKEFNSYTFGKWVFYEFPGPKFTPKIFSTNDPLFAYPYTTKSSFFPGLKSTDLLVNPKDNVVKQIPDINNLSGKMILAQNSQVEEFHQFRDTESRLSNRLLARDLSSVQFTFELPENGVYQPFLESYRLEDFGLDPTKSLEIELDRGKAIWNIDQYSDAYLRFTPLALSQGKHNVVLRLKNKNLIFGGEFSDGEVFARAGEGKGEGLYKIEDNNQDRFLSITNIDKADITAKFKVLSFDPMADYYIEMKYKQIYGNNSKVLISQSTQSSLLKANHESMPNYPEWNLVSVYYDPVRVTSDMYVELTAPYVRDPLGTKVLYDGLKVYKIFSNDLFFIKKRDSNLLSLPQVDFTKLSSSLYEAEIKGADKPHVIVFSENYSPQWEVSAYDNFGSRLNLNPYHFSANLYANAWYFEKTPENYKMRIYYKPQTLFSFGLLIAILTIIFSTAALLFILLCKVKKIGR